MQLGTIKPRQPVNSNFRYYMQEQHNPHNENHVTSVRREIVKKSNDLLEGRGDYLETIRSLCSLRFLVTDEDHDPDFMLFVEIDWETMHIPSAETRSEFFRSWLDDCDRDIFDVQHRYSSAIIAACQILIKRFSC
jgi:hypothetical protein